MPAGWPANTSVDVQAVLLVVAAFFGDERAATTRRCGSGKLSVIFCSDCTFTSVVHATRTAAAMANSRAFMMPKYSRAQHFPGGLSHRLTSSPVDAIRFAAGFFSPPSFDSEPESRSAPPPAVPGDPTHAHQNHHNGRCDRTRGRSARRAVGRDRLETTVIRGDRQRPRQSARARLRSRQGAVRRRGWTRRQRRMHRQRRRCDRVLRLHGRHHQDQ